MKRRIRLISVIVLLCICGTFLSSCEYIDDLRSERAVYIQEDGETKILIYGEKYVELEGFRVKGDTLGLYNSGYVAEADVPILLVELFGDPYGYVYNEIGLIMVKGKFYCNEDYYDYYTGIINKTS